MVIANLNSVFSKLFGLVNMVKQATILIYQRDITNSMVLRSLLTKLKVVSPFSMKNYQIRSFSYPRSFGASPANSLLR
jgi:hypothetical protein